MSNTRGPGGLPPSASDDEELDVNALDSDSVVIHDLDATSVNSDSVVIRDDVDASSVNAGSVVIKEDDVNSLDSGSVVTHTTDQPKAEEVLSTPTDTNKDVNRTRKKRTNAAEETLPPVMRSAPQPIKKNQLDEFKVKETLAQEGTAKFSHPVVIAENARARRNVNKTDNRDWFLKQYPPSAISTAKHEVLAQEIMRLFMPGLPKAKFVTDKEGNIYTASRRVNARTDLLTLYTQNYSAQKADPNHLGIKHKLKDGTYKQLGNIAVMTMFLQDTDLKLGHLYVDGQDNIGRYDFDKAFASIREGKNNNSENKFMFTDGVLRNLPYSSEYGADNWLDEKTPLRTRNDDQMLLLDHELIDNPLIRREINEQLLKILLMPESVLREVIGLHNLGMMEELKVESFFQAQHQQFKNAALNNPEFRAFLASENAMALCAKFAGEIREYKPAGANKPLDFSAEESSHMQVQLESLRKQAIEHALAPVKVIKNSLSNPLRADRKFPVDAMRAIVTAEIANRNNNQLEPFHCSVVSIQPGKEGEVFNVEFMKALREKHGDRSQLIIENNGHYTTIDFNFSDTGSQCIVCDAAADPRDIGYYKLLRGLEDGGKSVFTRPYVITANSDERNPTYIQKDDQSCPAYAIELACQFNAAKDIYQIMEKAHMRPNNEASQLEDPYAVLSVDWLMLPPEFIYNAQSRGFIDKYLVEHQGEAHIHDAIPSSDLTWHSFLETTKNGTSAAETITETFDSYQESTVRYLETVPPMAIMDTINSVTSVKIAATPQDRRAETVSEEDRHTSSFQRPFNN